MNFSISQRFFTIGLVALALFISGCSDANGSLSGSLDGFYSLDFDQARVRVYSSELAIEYVAVDGQVPVRVSLHKSDGVFETGTYDLKERGDITGQRGDTRIPRFLSGTLTIESFGGGDIEASFEATFQTGRDESTLSGEVSAPLEEVEGPRGYGFDTNDTDAGIGQDAQSDDDAATEEDAN